MKKGASISELLEAMAGFLSPEEVVASTVKAHVANQIAEWRISHKMSQQDFANYFGVNQSTVSKWENGDFNFSLEKLSEIACKLDLNLTVSLSAWKAETASVETTSSPTNNISYFPGCYRDSDYITSGISDTSLQGSFSADLMEG